MIRTANLNYRGIGAVVGSLAHCVLLGCISGSEGNGAETFAPDTTPHPALIHWQETFFAEMDAPWTIDDSHNGAKKIRETHCDVKYLGPDTLIATTILDKNCCGVSVGDIEFSGDTLKLRNRHIDEVAY